MIWVLIAAPVAVVALVVGSNIVGGRQMRRVLAEFDAETGTELVPVAAVSTLPVPDEDGWSSHAGFNAWAAWLDLRELAESVVPTTDALIFDGLHAEMADVLAIEPAPQRELEGATR